MFTGCAEEAIRLPSKIAEPEPMIPATYLIGPGDELEILYHIDPGFTLADYVIDTEDTLRIDFYYYPVMSKTVKVRPDGFITLPRVGDIRAAGEKPGILSQTIQTLFAPYLSRPVITVEVLDFNVKVEKLKTAIHTTIRGQSKQAIVRPDGRITVPYLRQDVMAAGKNTAELSQELETKYRELIRDISITASVLNANSNRAYIMGDVNRPDYYALAGPITLLQLVARAGGFTKEANLRQVVVISRAKQGKPEAAVVDAEGILKRGESDPLIRQYDVVYVPRTWLADAAFKGDAIWRLIPVRFSGTAIYSINDDED
ncbi:MAG: polysaccharide biosynthesis/export family protein [Desulfobacterales bacterium]